MAHVTTPPPPGSMTVPPLFGWEHILTVLAIVVALAVAFLVIWATGAGVNERADWQAWLVARSSRRRDPAADSHDPTAELVRPEPRP